MKGEFEKEIKPYLETTVEEISNKNFKNIIKTFLEAVDEARKEFPSRDANGVTHYFKNGREVIDGNMHPEHYRNIAMEWFEKWFGSE